MPWRILPFVPPHETAGNADVLWPLTECPPAVVPTTSEVPFIGRSEELARLDEVARRLQKGEGGAVLLGGETGIGKSRLAAEFLRRLEAQGILALRARCLPEAPAPYLPLFDALKTGGLVHLLALERPPRVEYLYLASPNGIEIGSAGRASSPLDRDIFLSMLSAVESFVTDSLSSFVDAGSRRLNALGYGEWRIIIVSRPFGNLVAVIRGTESEALIEALEASLGEIGKRFGPELKDWDGNRTKTKEYSKPLHDVLSSGKFDGLEEAVDPKDRKYRVLEGLARGLAKETARRPIALFLDDLHLADSATLAAVQYLVRSCRHIPFLLLATYRTEELVGPSGASNPLSAARATLLGEGLLVEIDLGPLDEAEVRSLAQDQLGVEDLDDELVTTVYRETRGAPFFALEVLRFLREEGHLERIGGTVRLKGGLETGSLPAQLGDAVRRRLTQLPRHDRDILECAAVDGDVFSPSRLACALEIKRLSLMRTLRTLEEEYHLVRLRGDTCSFDHTKIREVVYEGIHPDLRREYHAAVAECCVKEIEAGAHHLAVVAAFHFATANDARGRPYILQAAERAAAASSNLEAAEWYGRYIELTPDDPGEGILSAYGTALLYAGKYERAARVLENLVKRAGDAPRRDDYLRDLAEAEADQHGFERAVPLLDKYRPAGEGLAWAKWAVVRSRYALRVGEVDRAEADVNRALPILQEQGGTQFDIAEAYSVLSFVGETVGDYDQCIDFGKKALEAAGEAFPLLAMYYNNVGVGCLFRGRFEEANRYLTRGLEIAEAKTDLFRVALISNNLGLLHTRWGDTRTARDHLLRGLKFAERIESPFLTGMSLDFLGFCAAEERRDEEAAAFYQRSLPATDKGGDKGQMIWLRLHLAQLELERGDPEQALAIATEAYEIAAQSGDAPEQASARTIMAGAMGITGDPDAAQRLFADSVRGLKFSPAQFEYGEALRTWGNFLVDVGRLEEATEKLTQARVVFDQLGAKGRSRLLEQLLKDLGNPPPPAKSV